MDQNNNRKTHSLLSGLALTFSLIALILASFSVAINLDNSAAVNHAALDSPKSSNSSALSLDNSASDTLSSSSTIAEVAAKVAPSVVSIVTEVKSVSYNFFYGETESTGTAAGTGIIVSEDGYLITNKHVIDGATKIYAILDDGTVHENVKLITTDPLNDIAYLKIADVSGLPVAQLGDSKTIAIGQQVIAIGNAMGQYQNSVTSGIISSTGRSLTATDASYQTSETLVDMIQTDAAINSGNSGGPLVNTNGEVIGINTAVSSGNGIGFAIPISSVKGMLKSLLATGTAKRAYAGIQYSNIDAAMAIENNLPSNYGAYIYAVIKNSPAATAGLKEGDIILAIDNIKIGANRSLSTLLGEHSAGDEITIIYLRDGKESSTKLKLAEYVK